MSNDELKKIIGENIRRLRHKRKLTQADLSELVDREASTIANIEAGNQLIGVELLTKFAAVFSVSVDTLLQAEGTSLHLTNIKSMLERQSEIALSHMEPIIRVLLSEYGDPISPERQEERPEPAQKG